MEDECTSDVDVAVLVRPHIEDRPSLHEIGVEVSAVRKHVENRKDSSRELLKRIVVNGIFDLAKRRSQLRRSLKVHATSHNG